MFNWNRQVIDSYRDRFLLWPVLLFSILAIANIVAPESPGYRSYGIKLALCALVAVLLAKERLMILLVTGVTLAAKLAVALVVTRNWKAYGAAFLVGVGIIIVLLPAVRKWKSSYQEERKTSLLGIVFVVAGMIAAVIVVLLLKPQM